MADISILAPKICSIYTLSHPVTSEIRYVGKTTKSLKRRLECHLADRRNNHRTCWIKSITNIGLLPIIELVEEVDNSDWQLLEKYWIAQFKNWGFNLVNSGEGGEGVDMTTSVREKIGKAHLGRIDSLETIEKRSIKLRGQTRTLEQRKNMSNGWKKKLSKKPYIQSEKQLLHLQKLKELMKDPERKRLATEKMVNKKKLKHG